jgi:hypothetical protein
MSKGNIMRLKPAILAGLCLILPANTALAACIGARDAAALRVASLQQRLMVAGLACKAGDAYNRFVLGHRAELQRSDDDLKSYFVRNGGEAGYDSYKTRLANLAAHGPATDRNAFCAATEADFRGLADHGDLLAAAAGEKMLAGDACEAPILAAKDAPVRVARNEDVVASSPRTLPPVPYADAPPPRPQAAVATRDDVIAAPQAVVASRDDYADAPRVREDYAPPRPAVRSARYWYYRRLYAERRD